MEFNFEEMYSQIDELGWVPDGLDAFFGIRLFNLEYDSGFNNKVDSLISMIIKNDDYDRLKRMCMGEDLFTEYWLVNFKEQMTKKEFMDQLFEDYKEGLKMKRFTNWVRVDILEG